MSMISKYEDFLLEKLLLESQVRFSTKFNKFLNDIVDNSDNEIAEALLKLNDTDQNIDYNYIDITDNENDSVSFIANKKADAMITKANEPDEWEVWDFSGNEFVPYLTNSEKNAAMFQELGVEMPLNDGQPDIGEVGDIKAQAVSKMSGKTYCLFEWGEGVKKKVILNKVCLRPFNSVYREIWNVAKNKIKVGRLVRSLLNSTGSKFTDKDIEVFVNKFKSRFDIMKNAMSRLDVVNGKDIAHWYKDDNYADKDRGTLGSSCMKDVDEDFFDIYVFNKDKIALLVLYDESGETIDGKYTSKKIMGRALVWHTDQGDIFIDRIYTQQDHDVELFKQYAEKNNWWYKTRQDSGSDIEASNGSMKKEPTYTVTVTDVNFEKYPYLDSMYYINTRTNKISNSSSEIKADRELTSTMGSFSEEYQEDDFEEGMFGEDE